MTVDAKAEEAPKHETTDTPGLPADAGLGPDDRSLAEVRAALDAVSVVWAPYRSFAEVVASLEAGAEPTHIASVLNQPGVGPYLAPGSPLVAGGRCLGVLVGGLVISMYLPIFELGSVI